MLKKVMSRTALLSFEFYFEGSPLLMLTIYTLFVVTSQVSAFYRSPDGHVSGDPSLYMQECILNWNAVIAFPS